MRLKYILIYVFFITTCLSASLEFSKPSGGGTGEEVTLDTSSFGVNLSPTDTTVQKALDTLDELSGAGEYFTDGTLRAGGVSTISPNNAWDITSKIVSVYALDETSGTSVADGVGTNTGTTVSNITNMTSVTAKLGTSFYFSAPAGNEYINCGNDTSLRENSTLSVFLWVQADGGLVEGSVPISRFNTVGNKRIWSINNNGGKLQVVLSDDGTFTAGNVKNYSSSVTAFESGVWHFIGFTFNAGTLKLYVDGSEDTSPTKTTDAAITSLYNTDTNLIIGGLNNGGASLFTGVIDQVYFADEVFTSADITGLYNSGDATVSLGSGTTITVNAIGSSTTISSVHLDNTATAKDFIVEGSLEIQDILYLNSGITVKRNPQTLDYTILSSDYLIAYTTLVAQRTLTLLDALLLDGRVFFIKDESGNAGTNNIVIDPEGDTTINGSATETISTNYDSRMVYSDGTNWFSS